VGLIIRKAVTGNEYAGSYYTWHSSELVSNRFLELKEVYSGNPYIRIGVYMVGGPEW